MDRRTWKEPVDERIVADGLFLEHRAMLHITRGAGLLVSAQTGTLWITHDGKLDDIVLTSGQWHRIEIQANWRSDPSGYIKVWVDGVKRLEQFNLATTISDPMRPNKTKLTGPPSPLARSKARTGGSG